MARVFVAHSRLDTDLVNFFSNAFLDTGVVGIFEEIEKITTVAVTPQKVMQDISKSNAVFIILSHNVQGIPHTRDWVVWEAGVSKSKDIWVFEPQPQFDSISIIIPYLRHYVSFDITDEWLAYIREIIESYDDSHVLQTVLRWSAAGAGTGAALDKKDPKRGVAWGTLGGTFVGAIRAASAKSRKRPTGLSIVCDNCDSSFNIHIPQRINSFRCPVCNVFLELGY